MRSTKTLLTSLFVWVAFGSFSISQQAPPSFLNTIAIGDSLTAAVQNGSLNEKGQIGSYAYWIARQVGTFMFLPLIT
ncbi:hypothetical protein MYX65_13160, partial [Acidobacteria bacterium AH-259-L09]|nr:hypothetical protein [Acidobacteria bacterium AH-259-L09]